MVLGQAVVVSRTKHFLKETLQRIRDAHQQHAGNAQSRIRQRVVAPMFPHTWEAANLIGSSAFVQGQLINH
jgi:hypothetical protein